ncbi:MAG: hypothetical protein KC503_41995 [Myxococcales bacterium]|nr:hypothetical protein [Myxococcales bacterium]
MNQGSAVSALPLVLTLSLVFGGCASYSVERAARAAALREASRPESPLDCTNPGILARLRCKRRHGSGWSATVPLIVNYRSALTPRYRPLSLRYIVNGRTGYSWQRAFRDTQPPLNVRAGGLEAFGDRTHKLHVTLTYRGHGHGTFRYLRTLRIHIDLDLELRAEPNTPLCVTVDAWQRHSYSIRDGLKVRLQKMPRDKCRRLAATTP